VQPTLDDHHNVLVVHAQKPLPTMYHKEQELLRGHLSA
jgi:hypothetical protein